MHQWALYRNKCSDGKLRTYVKFKTVYGRENYLSLMFWRNLTKFRIPSFTSGHFEIRKSPKNYQNLLRTFIETFTPNFIQIRLVVLK
jgi:hypothetical protein